MNRVKANELKIVKVDFINTRDAVILASKCKYKKKN